MATLTYDTKNDATLTYDNKSSAGSFTYDRVSGVSFLLTEAGDYLLQENGDRIILEPSSNVLTLDTKN